MLVLCIPTLNRFDLLVRCIASARAGSVAPDRVLVVDNSGGQCPPIESVEIITPRRNLGVAASWNAMIERAGPEAQIIISNDDIVFAPDTIERLLVAAENNVRAGTVSAIDGQKFSLFYLNQRCAAEVGPFDEAFYPAYFEDNDYVRRMELSGWQAISAPSAVEHAISATRAAMSDEEQARSHRAFRRNAAYFVAKWGLMPHQGALYEAPFGVPA